jgi:predicted hotdog family 3-hydroxylacyl-ACP dehydratase
MTTRHPAQAITGPAGAPPPLRPCPYAVAQLVPQAPPMILIDAVVGWHEAGLVATLEVRPDGPFFEAGKGVAAHVALEWMAQTCAAFVGAQAREAGQPVRIGFLLGTRAFTASVPWFLPGERVEVAVSLSFRDEEMAVFDCQASGAAGGVAVAALTVYQPLDLEALLAAQGISMEDATS